MKVVRHALSLDERREKFQASFFEKGDKSDVKEVWFAGCHADVGGGAVDETEQNLLSNNSFRWMINELFKYDSDAQILFHTEKLQREAGYTQKKYEEAPTRGYLWLESIPEDFLKQYGLKKLKLSKREQEGCFYTQGRCDLQELFPLSKPPVKGCIYKLPAAGSSEDPSPKFLEEGYVFLQSCDCSSGSIPLKYFEEKHIRIRVVDKSHESLKDVEGESKYILLVRDTSKSFWERTVKLCLTIGNLPFSLFRWALYIIFTVLGFLLRPLLMLFFVLGRASFHILKVIMFCFGYNPEKSADTIDVKTRVIDFWDKILSFLKGQDRYEQSFAFYDRPLGDSLFRTHDQLDHWYWWIIEFFPITHYLRRREGNQFKTCFRMNKGKGREIYRESYPISNQLKAEMIYVHESVRTRIETGTYKPRAWFYVASSDHGPPREFEWDLFKNQTSGLYEFDEKNLKSDDLECWKRIQWVK